MTTRKTIAFAIHSLNAGGAERVVSSLANELVKDYSVKIITLEKCESFYELDSRIKLLTCNSIIPEKQSKINALKNHFGIINKLSRLIKLESIDLLIGFTTSVNVFSIIAARLNNIPIVISERNNPNINPPNRYWRILRNTFYKFSNYLIVQTIANKDFYSSIIPSSKIIIIKNPIAATLASKRITKDNIKTNKSILNVGRLDANKSQDLLIKAFANISNKDGWCLQLLGIGNKMKQYKKIVKKLNLESSVFFLGNVSNVYDYYNNASIFAFTSKSEGYPNALAEALYFGLPSISTNCPHGPSDLITNEDNGLLIKVNDQDMLETQLKRLMTDNHLRCNLSKNAISKSEKLDIKLIKSQWISCFNKLL